MNPRLTKRFQVGIPAVAVWLLLFAAWFVGVPALLDLPGTAGSGVDPGGVLRGAGWCLATATVVMGLLLWRWAAGSRFAAARYPHRLAFAAALGAVCAAPVGFAAVYGDLPAPAGAALVLADLGAGVLAATVALPLGHAALGWLERLGPAQRSAVGPTDSEVPGGSEAGGAQRQDEAAASSDGSRGPALAAGGPEEDSAPARRGGRVGIRGLLVLLTLGTGFGAAALLVAHFEVRTTQDRWAARTAMASALGHVLARQMEDLPRERLPVVLRQVGGAPGVAFWLATATGRAYPPASSPSGRSGFSVRVHGGRCSLPDASPLRRIGGRCLALGLPFPHDDLRLVAVLAPPWDAGFGSGRLVGLLGAFLAAACLLAWLLGADAAEDLEGGARRLFALVRKAGPSAEPAAAPRSSDEVGALLQQLALLRDALAADLERVEASVTLTRAQEREQARYLEAVSVAVRSKLAGLRGHVELFLSDPQETPTPAQRDDAQVLLESCDQLLGILQDLLDLSYAESGELRMAPEPVDLAALLESQVAAHRPLAQRAGLRLVWSAPEGLPRVRLDPVQIRRVVGNLLSNALKFTGEGEVAVTAERAEPGWVRVSVRDTGPGIAPEHQAVIFEQYRQAPQDRARAQRGSGLGLAIVRQIVRLHGGRVGLASELGAGSVFWFELPVSGPNPPSGARAGDEASADRDTPERPGTGEATDREARHA